MRIARAACTIICPLTTNHMLKFSLCYLVDYVKEMLRDACRTCGMHDYLSSYNQSHVENFTLLFGRLRQRNAQRCVLHVRHARLFVPLQPIKSLVCCVAVAIAVIVS